MKRLILAFAFLVLPLPSGAATITAENAGGNWSVSGTWVGGVIPDPGTDTVIIPSGMSAAVVIDTSRTIPPTTVEDLTYGLVQGTSVTTTLGGALTIGNGTSKDGKFTFGAGSTLALGANNLILGNCRLASNATTESWVIVTGSGNIQTHGTVTQPKQDITLRYTSFQNTGSKTFALSSTTGSVTSGIDMQYCASPSAGTWQIGTGGTSAAANHTVMHNDFIDTGNFTVSGSSGSGVIDYRDNRFVYTASNAQRVFTCGKTNTDLRGSVFYGFKMDATSVGSFNLTDTFWGVPSSYTATSAQLLSVGRPSESVVDNIYIYAPPTSENPHPFGVTPTAATTTNVTNMVIEMYNTESSDGGNAYLVGSGSGTINYSNNLLIGSGTMISVVGAHTTTINATNNTQVVTYPSAYGKPTALFFSENGETSGSVTLKNNLVVGDGGISEFFCRDNGAPDQTIALSDYNAWYNIATAYSGCSVTAGQTNDLAMSSGPLFVDESRTLATWNGNSTDAQSIAQLLAIDGYNSETKIQSGPLSGVTIRGLLDYVRGGMTPTNPALATSGEGGTYIGAMEPLILAAGAALMMGM